MPLTLGLIQIANVYTGQAYLPYAAGLLQAAAQAVLPANRLTCLPILWERLPLPQAVARLSGADVLLFSTWLWNIRYSLALAQAVKETSPHTLVVFGGHQVPRRVQAFLTANPWVDLAVHGEGEPLMGPLLQVLEAGLDYAARGPHRRVDALQEALLEVPSLGFLDRQGRLVQTPPAPRATDLSIYPSPYLTGIFDGLLAEHPEGTWAMLLESNRGCPCTCAFCDWGAGGKQVTAFPLPRVEAELAFASRWRLPLVFCCDANFGSQERDLHLAQVAARLRRESGYPGALTVQFSRTRPERLLAIQRVLVEAGLSCEAPLAVQSVDPTTLRTIHRPFMGLPAFARLQQTFARARVGTYTDLILGLPGETYASFAQGLTALLDAGQHHRLQLGNLAILPNATLGDPDLQAAHGLRLVEVPLLRLEAGQAVEEPIQERLTLVVGTSSLPPADWVRARALASLLVLFHFHRLLTLPLVLLRQVAGWPYHEVLEAFLSPSVDDYPLLADLRDFFRTEAGKVARGGPEVTAHAELPGWHLAPEDLSLIRLRMGGRLEAFYREAGAFLETLRASRGQPDGGGAVEGGLPAEALADAVRLSGWLLEASGAGPEQVVGLDWRVWEVLEGALVGERVALEPGPVRYRLDLRQPYLWRVTREEVG